MFSVRKKSFQFSDNEYAIIISTIFLLLGAIIAVHHEMWRDEIQAYLLARDSSSPIELFKNLKYEGHPSLWHLCLYMLKFITRSPIIMQPFHLIIAATTVYLFLRFSPFTRLQKALFAFGYFPFYEYAIVCRNYAIGVFLLFVFCTLFKNWKEKFPFVGFILLLLAHTSVHALIIVISIGIALCWQLIFTSNRPNKIKIGIGSFLILFGIITSVIQLKAAPDQGTAPGWMTKLDLNHLRNVINIIPRAFFPIPQFTFHFWGSNLLDKLPASSGVKLVLSGLILFLAIVILLRKPTALLMCLSGTIGLLAFFYTKYSGAIRHWGFLFILFLASLWISHYCYNTKQLFSPLNRLSIVFKRNLNKALTIILIIHLVGGVAAASMDYKYPFSQGKAVARFIKEAKLDDMLIATAAPDDLTLEILGYLEKDKFYYPRTKRFGSFGVWDMKWRRGRSLPMNKVLQEIQRLSDERGEDILVISVYPLGIAEIPKVAAPLEIGRTEGDNNFKGLIDEFLIVKKALTQEEILNHFNGGVATSIDKLMTTETDVVLAMPFEEGKGEVTKDLSPHGNDGTLNDGVKWEKGKFGQALEFDGKAGFLDAGDNESLDLNETDFTIALWANFRKLEHITFVGKDEGSGKVNKWFFGVRYEWFEEGDLTLHINSPDMAGVWVASKSWSGDTDKWYQIALVKKENKYSFYVDGKEVYTFYVPIEIKQFGPSIINGEIQHYCLYLLTYQE